MWHQFRPSFRTIASSRCFSSLVLAEHNGKALSGATLSTITAAHQLGKDVTLLVSGAKSNTQSIVQSACQIPNLTKVLHVDDPKYDHALAENMVELLYSLQQSHSFSHILAPTSNSSKNYLPRLGAKLDVAPISDIIQVIDESTFVRPTYAGNAISKVHSVDTVKLITVRPTGFEKMAAEGGNALAEQVTTLEFDSSKSEFVSEQISQSERPDLTAARVVISGGRGLKSGENFELLYELADKLGGAVGASRAAVDAGFVPNELQVGQTGKVVAPELYIAVGISGAIQHLAGMKDSKTIVAINKDEEAPIFQVADFGLVGDLFQLLPELTEKI
uniref:Electron transfer flavoprotein subunit alpha n=1 Tax=Albugo laibachii Nc14 TaxID=890382 RepID=F0WVC4_9STRA|nr:electron transfer flavoprotein subunit alpha putativ [Albugo laibachii Nc14]|eukprot:CCA25363.1 electron transfer flavoprotein subunit alpha putativ [Albugo laibachii Nc14]